MVFEQEGDNPNTITIPDELLEGYEDVLPSEEPENDNAQNSNNDDNANDSNQDVDDVNTEATQEENEEQEDNHKTEKEKSLERGLNKERKARKEVQKKNKELEERIKALEEANKTPEKTTLDTLIESGVEEGIAKSIASAIDNKDNSKKIEEEIAELRFEKDLTAKSKEKGFEDIEEYADEIKELVDKGLSIEQAYYATSYNKPKTVNTKREIERKLEAKMQNNNAKKQILGNTNSNVGASSNSNHKVNLSKEEYAVAKAAGMTPEEYAAVKGMGSIKDYTNYTARKKK